MVLVGGDDELVGRQVFNIINSLYSKEKLYVLYSNYLNLQGETSASPLTVGASGEYTNYVKKGELFRGAKLGGHGHLHTLLSDLFFMVANESFMRDSLHFYKHSALETIMASALELSCGRHYYLP